MCYFQKRGWKSPAMPARVHCPRQTNNSCRAARLVYINARVSNFSDDWVPPGEAAVRRLVMRAMCPTVSGEKPSPTENAGYSACLGTVLGTFLYMCKITKFDCVISEIRNGHIPELEVVSRHADFTSEWSQSSWGMDIQRQGIVLKTGPKPMKMHVHVGLVSVTRLIRHSQAHSRLKPH
jgi:hypothetical protein